LPWRWQHARGLRLALASIFPVLATRLGAAPYNPMLATLGGYAYMLTLTSLLFVPSVRNTTRGLRLMLLTTTIFYIIDGAPSATSTSVRYIPVRQRHRLTTSIRQHPHGDSATMRLHRPRYTRTLFGAPTRGIQDYNIEARLEFLPDSTNRLDTRGLLTRV
jgi:hypothetical protein